ncbi:MAG: hypothetical protein Q7J07_00865, partial [Pelolinea sp.]|nr:hypothetical protein [Pelolinea sp.]
MSGDRRGWVCEGQDWYKVKSRLGNLRPSQFSAGVENGDTLSDGASSPDQDRVLAPHSAAELSIVSIMSKNRPKKHPLC